MAKVVKKKLTSKTKKRVQKPKITTEVEIESVEKEEPVEETQSSSVLPETESPQTVAPNDLSESLLSLNNNTNMETKEESTIETVMPEDESFGQPENITDTTPIIKTLSEDKAEEISSLTDNLNVEENNLKEEKKKKPFITILIVLLVFILGVFVGGFVVYKKGNIFTKKGPEIKENISENQEQILPSPSPVNEPVDLTKYSIKILNGSGKTGMAGKLKDVLTEEGFEVSSTGNATSSSFTNSVIIAKEEVDKSYLKKLEDFLSNTYTLSEIQQLEDSEKTEVVVIIGTE
jgi:hypothetical protein